MVKVSRVQTFSWLYILTTCCYYVRLKTMEWKDNERKERKNYEKIETKKLSRWEAKLTCEKKEEKVFYAESNLSKTSCLALWKELYSPSKLLIKPCWSHLIVIPCSFASHLKALKTVGNTRNREQDKMLHKFSEEIFISQILALCLAF